MKKIVILGSTGSIGRQTLDIVRAFPGEFDVVGLAAYGELRMATHRLLHRTTEEAAKAILRDGFRDAEGTSGTGQMFKGVWLSDVPLDAIEGATGDVLLEVTLEISDKDLRLL